MKITKGDKYEEITNALVHTDNHCPCIPKYARTEETVCICTEFLDQQEIGPCRCGRYYKEEV